MAAERAYAIASSKIKRFNRLGRRLSQNDIKVVFYSQLLVELSPGRSKTQFCEDFGYVVANAKNEIDVLWETQAKNQTRQETPNYQLALF